MTALYCKDCKHAGDRGYTHEYSPCKHPLAAREETFIGPGGFERETLRDMRRGDKCGPAAKLFESRPPKKKGDDIPWSLIWCLIGAALGGGLVAIATILEKTKS